MIVHVTVYYYSKLYNTSLSLVYLIEPIARNGLIKIESFPMGQSFVLRLGYHVGEEKGIASCLPGGGLVKCIDGVVY